MIHDIALVPEETIYKYLLLIYVNMLHQNGAATRDWRLDNIRQFYRFKQILYIITLYRYTIHLFIILGVANFVG